MNSICSKAEYFRMKDENKSLSDKEKTCRSESGELRKYLSDLDRFNLLSIQPENLSIMALAFYPYSMRNSIFY